MGVITAHGTGLKENLRGLIEGRNSIAPVGAFDVSGYRGRSGGEVGEFSLANPLKVLRADRLDRASMLLLKAFEEATSLPSFPGGGIPDCPVMLGTTLGGMNSGMKYHRLGLEKGFDRVSGADLLDYMAHTQANNLKKEYNLRGDAMTFSDACTSGANSIGHAFTSVRSGLSDVAIAGGYDTMSEFTLAGFNSLQAVTETVCRPFDLHRSGLVLGEGAAILILEELSSALARGARPIAEIIGYGSTSDAYHMTRPDPEGSGARRAMTAALDDAGLHASCVDYINAHGTGTPYNDAMEARAICSVFPRGVPVSSTKSMIGHTLGAAGAVEAIFTIMAITDGFLPPNINFKTPDKDCPVSVVTEPHSRASVKTAMTNSFGFGGANAALIFKAAEGCHA